MEFKTRVGNERECFKRGTSAQYESEVLFNVFGVGRQDEASFHANPTDESTGILCVYNSSGGKSASKSGDLTHPPENNIDIQRF